MKNSISTMFCLIALFAGRAMCFWLGSANKYFSILKTTFFCCIPENIYILTHEINIQKSFIFNCEVYKMPEARCMKCKKQVEIKEPKDVKMKNGMNAVKGSCPKCGTKVFRIVGKA